MALDKVHNRLFIGHHGNSRYDIYQLDRRGLPLRRHADYSIGRSLIGRGFAFAPLGKKYLNFPAGADFDYVHQRLFVPDNSSLGPPGARILVFDVRPETLKKLQPGEFPEAIAVLGQPDFDHWDPGTGPNKIGGRGSAVVDSENQRLFFTDSANNRILVWDIRPERLKNGMDAMAVIGQPDFESKSPGIGRNRVAGVGRQMAYDPNRNQLFVPDSRNQRVLVFDVSPGNLHTGMDAMAVIGQPDFTSRQPRRSLRKIKPEVLELDYKYHRLFEGEQFDNRLLVFDVDPSRLKEAQNPDAVAVIGQPDFETTDPAVSRNRLTMPRITIDSERQLAYIPDGYPAGNRINIVDIAPDRMKTTLTPVLDQIGHINADGTPDFLTRSANDRTSPRYWTQGRDVAIDTVDHRLFLSDNYGHRILIFQLDRLNRIQDRDAKWALGQKDVWTSVVAPGRTASSIKLPLAVEYDESYKRLFVADTWNDRVLVFDMTPGQVHSGMDASYVLGQADFTSRDIRVARNRTYFASRAGAGIYPGQSRAAEMAVDTVNQRLFLTDGGHHRVLVFDIHPDRLHNGADAIAVIGQKDFVSVEEGHTADRWRLPGDLVYDEEYQRLFVEAPWANRVLVFDVTPDKLKNGMSASLVIGQPDFTSTAAGFSRRRIRQPDGISYDTVNRRLHVTDKYHHRVLIFDARPDVLQNFPAAIGVIGEIDYTKVRMGPGDPRSFQDRLHDPRGNAFDAQHQRLFQTEGLNTRITVFTFPRDQYEVDLPARAGLKYESLDARTSRGAEDLRVGHSVVKLDQAARVLGISTHLVTRPQVEKQSERESRLLISEAMLPVREAARDMQLFYDSRAGTKLSLSVVNPGVEPATVRFRLDLAGSEELQANRTLAPGAQLSVEADQLFGGLQRQSTGSLWIASDRPIQVEGLSRIPNGRGDGLILPAPDARPQDIGAGRRILPRVVTGAGFQMSYVLMNPTEKTLNGTLSIGGQTLPYTVAPRGVFIQEEEEIAQPVETGYARVAAKSESEPVPAIVGILRGRRRDGSLRTVRVIRSGQEGTLFWAPIDTYPSMLRHGRISAELTVVNAGPVPATIYLELFDQDGQSRFKVERIVPLGDQVELELGDLFGRSRLRGTLRVFSDSEVALSLEKKVVNIENEVILSDIPLQETPISKMSRLIFPFFSNGSGAATELHMINTSKSASRGKLSVLSPDGKADRIILR